MKKQGIRLLCIALILQLMLLTSGCSQQTVLDGPESENRESTPVAELEMWYWGSLRVDMGDDQYLSLAEDWNKENPAIQVRTTSFGIEEYRTKIKTALAAGEAPDLFYMWSGSFVRPYLQTGNMMVLDEYLSDEIRNKLKPGTLDACTYDGNIYSVPIYTFLANLYCNTELFEKAGVPLPYTYDDFLVAIGALKRSGITPIVLGQKDRWPGIYWYDILAMRTAGLPGCRDALQYPALFERQEFVEAAELLVDLFDMEAFNTDAFELGYVEMVERFRQGGAAMMYLGNFADHNMEVEDSEVKGKLSVIPFPVMTDRPGHAREFLGGNIDSFYVRFDTAHPEEAVQVLLYISERAGREGEVAGKGISCWKPEPDAVIQTSELARQSIALMDTASAFLGWWDTILPANSSESHKNLVADLMDNRLTPEEFTSEMAKLIGGAP